MSDWLIGEWVKVREGQGGSVASLVRDDDNLVGSACGNGGWCNAFWLWGGDNNDRRSVCDWWEGSDLWREGNWFNAAWRGGDWRLGGDWWIGDWSDTAWSCCCWVGDWWPGGGWWVGDWNLTGWGGNWWLT